MESSVIECEKRGECACRGGVGESLGILKQVQRLYEDRLEHIERTAGANRLQLQTDTLRAWVEDLLGQNTLLATAVEELEVEATSRVLVDKRRNQELVCELRAEVSALRRRLARKDSDVRGLVEVLRRLREFDYCTLEGIHFFEVAEADIFGSIEWRQKKLEEGDARRSGVKQEPTKRNRHFAVI